MSLRDLLDPIRYMKDESVGIVAVAADELPGPIEPQRWHHISERLWNRLLCLGQAYELHFASIADRSMDTVLNRPQTASLAEELAFLATVVNDAASAQAIG